MHRKEQMFVHTQISLTYLLCGPYPGVFDSDCLGIDVRPAKAHLNHRQTEINIKEDNDNLP